MIILEPIAFASFSLVQHYKSIAPSTVLGLYLAITTLIGIVLLRTLILIDAPSLVIGSAAAAFAVRCILNISENWSKRHILKESYLDESTRETTANFWSTSAQLWMLPLFNAGYSRELTNADLADFYSTSKTVSDADTLQANWRKRSSLLSALVHTFHEPLVACIFPGLVKAAATLVLPELINRFIVFTASYETANPNPASYGWGLAFSFFLVFLILAFSQGTYMISTAHLGTRIRGALVSILYTKSLTVSSLDNSVSSGKTSTYMSVDTQKIYEVTAVIHDGWQNLIVVGVALYLLYRQLQYAMFVVLAVILMTLLLPTTLAKQTVTANKAWGQKTEVRTGLITSFLQNMKTIKLSGYERSVVEPIIGEARKTELKQLKGWYRVLIWSIFFSETIEVLATASGFLAYALIHVRNGETLDTSRTFTALSLIVILVQPIGMILHSLPLFFAAYGSVMRLQEFLLVPDIDRATSRALDSKTVQPTVIDIDANVELKVRHEEFRLCSASFKWTAAGETTCLTNLSIRFPRNQLTMVIGEVGSGKSCLLHSLLGETYLFSGSVERPDKPVALCTQDAWIRNASLKENIIASFEYDSAWYSTVISACDLLQDIDLLKDGDATLIGSKGQNLSGGQRQRVALARACYSRAPIYFFDDPFSAIDKTTEARIFSSLFGSNGLLKGRTVILVSHGISRLSAADQIVLLSNGQVEEQGPWSQVQSHGKIHALLSEAKTKQDDTTDADIAEVVAMKETKSIQRTDHIKYARGTAVYKWYIQLIGMPSFLGGMTSAAAHIGTVLGSQLWLRHWASQNSSENLGYYIGILWLLTILSCAALAINLSFTTLKWSIGSGSKAHKLLTSAVLRTKFSWFNNNPVGFIINRFSQDIFALDFEIPVNCVNVIFPMISIIGQLGIVCAAVPYLAITLPFMFYGLYLLQRYYLRTSRQVKTLSLESKTPLYTSFIETLEGITTIRAGKFEAQCAAENERRINLSQPSYFLQYAVNRALTQVLDLMTMLMATCLALLAVATRHSTSAGLIGLAFIQVLTLQLNLSHLIMSFTKLETAMVAVERIREFVNLPHEDPKPNQDHGKWLTAGAVQFRNVCAKYADDAPLTLKDVTFDIQAGEKIGICGRTGSGKSSLLLTLFRAMDYQTGKILIDGQDISELSLEDLRTNLTIVPQDPSLWQASIRDNLDPLRRHSDTEIWATINEVGLNTAIAKLSEGLDYYLHNGGVEFSAGQRQLLCLARACLKQSKIVVLDEATSSMDILTDQVVQKVLRTVFKSATVITIAHRIQTILDYDKILILDAGRVVDFDAPGNLTSERFTSMKTIV